MKPCVEWRIAGGRARNSPMTRLNSSRYRPTGKFRSLDGLSRDYNESVFGFLRFRRPPQCRQFQTIPIRRIENPRP
jgi:hypothetical protein